MSHIETFGDQRRVADWVAELLDQGLSDDEIQRILSSPEALMRVGHLVNAADLIGVMRGLLGFCRSASLTTSPI